MQAPVIEPTERLKTSVDPTDAADPADETEHIEPLRRFSSRLL